MSSLGYCVFLAVIVYSSASSSSQVVTCDDSECPLGHRCVLEVVQCVRAPCDPIRNCVPIEKPGSCPRRVPGFVGPCVARCFGDYSCEGDQKCCGSCPRDCTAPVPVERPGRCPPKPLALPGNWCGLFRDECTSDEGCPLNYKCCDTGCHMRCSRPFLDVQQQY